MTHCLSRPPFRSFVAAVCRETRLYNANAFAPIQTFASNAAAYSTTPHRATHSSAQQQETPSTDKTFSVDHEKTRAYLQAMKAQPRLYARADILGMAFTMTASDIVHVPRLRDTRVGDVLTLSNVSEIGGPKYAMRGGPFVNPAWHKVQCVVMEHPLAEKLFTEKFKRRKNYHRKIGHRQRYTVLRCTRVDVTVPEAEGMKSAETNDETTKALKEDTTKAPQQ